MPEKPVNQIVQEKQIEMQQQSREPKTAEERAKQREMIAKRLQRRKRH